MGGIGAGGPAADTADGRSEGDIVQDVQVGKQQRALGNQGHTAVFGADPGQIGAAKNDPTGVRGFESGHGAQQRTFPRSGRPQDGSARTALQSEVHVVQDLR